MSDNSLLSVFHAEAEGAFLLQRSATDAVDAAALLVVWREAITAAIDALAHAPDSRAVILDVRKARGRNDPAFERALPELHALLHQHFDAVVTLVRTSVGALQVSRLAREQGLSDLVASDEAEAFRMCRAAMAPDHGSALVDE